LVVFYPSFYVVFMEVLLDQCCLHLAKWYIYIYIYI